MATNTRLVTFNAQNVTPQDDGLLYETAIPQTGIIYGANLTANGTNTVHIDTGFGIVRGRFFEIFESDIAIPLSASGEIQGRIIGRLDLANIDEPFVILAQTGSLSPLRQDADVNIFNGVHEFLLATFMVNELTISSFQDVKPTTLGSQTIVNTLPTEGVNGVIYLVPQTDGNLYQYVWDGAWKPLGQDLSAYAKLDSPTFIGTPMAPTNGTASDKTKQIATDEFVQNAIRDSLFVDDPYKFSLTQTINSGAQESINITATELKSGNAGLMIGYVHVNFQSNANGRRYVNVQRWENGEAKISLDSRAEIQATNGGATQVTIPFISWMSSALNNTIGIGVWHNAGTALSATIDGVVRLIKYK